MMSAMGGWTGLKGRGDGTRVATLCTSRLGQCRSLLVILCNHRALVMVVTNLRSEFGLTLVDHQYDLEPPTKCRH